ncbi:MAG: ATP phosphoribosyltransferase [Candidatus Saccharicenans sp.]|uniref:ATP phosphoribosyltransferase n=1 Tax=Candidatus Saccharicenans sp. TaxID=2819258 RepID=UPI004049DF4B
MGEEKKLRILLPKGKIFPNVARLLQETNLIQEINERSYFPVCFDSEVEAKLMKPQNIPKLIEIGSHDLGFTGFDWVVETGAQVEEFLDLGFDRVKIVAAAHVSENRNRLKSRRIIAASEYENISRKYLEKEKFNFFFIKTYGTTEAFPPEDADLIIDNTATGQTLRANNLKIIDEIFLSSTRLIANRDALNNLWKKEKIDEILMLITSVLNARQRVMLEMNIPADKLETIVKVLPCMRAPTVAPLYNEMGYAVKVAVLKDEIPKLIPKLKKLGATDLLEYDFRKVVV